MLKEIEWGISILREILVRLILLKFKTNFKTRMNSEALEGAVKQNLVERNIQIIVFIT